MAELTARKRGAQRFGRRSERLAAWFLRFKGYRIVGTNIRLPGGELDLVARRGRVLVFVEIKARADDAVLAEAIAPRQWQRIAAAAEQFVARRPGYAGLDRRFDALFLVPRRWPRHMADAWRPS